MTRRATLTFTGVASLARQHKTELLRKFARVIDSGSFLGGSEVIKLEKSLEQYLRGGNVITVSSGHDALLYALCSLHLPAGSEVIIPANAYPTAFPVALSGVVPVPVDVDQNGQLSVTALEKAYTPKTRAVVMVHLYGQIGNVQSIWNYCKRHRLIFIEDAAQAFGASYKGKPIGTLGDIGCFSFYPTKNLGALGDGGAVWTKHRRIAHRIQQAKSYGETKRYRSQFISGHSRLPELQAAGLSLYLTHLHKTIRKRQKLYQEYRLLWKKFRLDTYGTILESNPLGTAAPHLLVASVSRRNELMKYLESHGIPTFIHYPVAVPHVVGLLPHLKHTSIPTATRLSHRIVSLPFHPSLRSAEIHRIITAIHAFYVSKYRT